MRNGVGPLGCPELKGNMGLGLFILSNLNYKKIARHFGHFSYLFN